MNRLGSQIFDFLVEEGAEMDEVKSDTLLFSSGIVDSFTLVSLMTFLEETYGLQIDPSDVTLENFDSIDFIVDFIQRADA